CDHASQRPISPETSCSRGLTSHRRGNALAELGAAAGAALFDPVDDRAAARLQAALEAREAVVDALPARADEIDEERQVVDAAVAFREQVALEPFEATDRLTHEPAD